MQVGLKRQKKCKYFHLQVSNGGSMQHIYIYMCSLAKNQNSSGSSHTGSLFTKEEQKRLTHDIMHTSATSVSFLHDVTDTECKIYTKWQRK